jgi:hypothetical protein
MGRVGLRKQRTEGIDFKVKSGIRVLQGKIVGREDLFSFRHKDDCIAIGISAKLVSTGQGL